MPKKLTPRGQAAAPPEVEPAPVAKKPAARKPRAKKTEDDGRRAIRNIRNVIVRVTLDEKRIELTPRGQRGDLAYVNVDQQEDPVFGQNVGMIYEVITREQAREILAKQANNQQVGPTVADALLNPLGQPYSQPPTMGPSNEEQAITVAGVHTDPTKLVRDQSQIIREPGAAPQLVDVPGSQPLTEEQVDQVARAANGESAGDVLRQAVNVSVEPTQKSGY